LEGWSEQALKNIDKDTQRTQVLVDDQDAIREAIETHNAKFSDEPTSRMQIRLSRLSRDLTLRKGVVVNAPLMNKLSPELNGLREKYCRYSEANKLDRQNKSECG
jgi:hypothetical protein